MAGCPRSWPYVQRPPQVSAVAATLVPVLEQVGEVVAHNVAQAAELRGAAVGQAELQARKWQRQRKCSDNGSVKCREQTG